MQADMSIKLEMSGDDESFWSLDGQSRICNRLNNELLQRANEIKIAYTQTGDEDFATMLYSKRGLRDLIPEIKKRIPIF